MYKEEKEVWVRFAAAALSALVSSGEYENDVKTDSELAADYADSMLARYLEKFGNC